ncbi:MAG: hypothetical protein JXX28_04910 [Deltaproteobacteria bacterium]|nr:hypothetical protein [Deltaproteobacteria bacterium]
MRRRALPTRRTGKGGTSLVQARSTSDLRFLEQVVTIAYPVRSATTYLRRNMGNPIQFRLVEARRGETPGVVRMIEVRHENGGEKTWIRGERVLANGEPASYYVPDHLVSIVPRVAGASRYSFALGNRDEIIVHVPVRGYLRFLPAVFQGQGPVSAKALTQSRSTALQRWGSGLPDEQGIDVKLDEDPMRRFLFVFQHVMTSVSERIDDLEHLTDPMLCEPKFLPWLASWVSFDLDGSLPVYQQRELVRRAIRLYRTRGTREGIGEMVRVLTAAPVRILERQKPMPMALGRGVLVGGKDVVERYNRGEPPGSYLLEPGQRADTSFFVLKLEPIQRFRDRFGERAAHVLRRIVQVVSQERPTHIAFTIQFDAR